MVIAEGVIMTLCGRRWRFMIRRYSGDKKSIEARTADNGRTWSVKLFDNGRLTEYSGGTLAEVDALAGKHRMTLDR
jgi:hypothetical protein